MVVKVNHGRMREDEARKYFQQLINAVDYCHSRGVYHRDLKVDRATCFALAEVGNFNLIIFRFFFVLYDAARKFTAGFLWKPEDFRFWIKCVPKSQGNI